MDQDRRTKIALVALVKNRHVLLVHRHPDRATYPDCWDLPGGHVEPGESAAEAARRECREELGIEIHDPNPVAMACSEPALVKHALIVTAWSGTPENLAADEHDDLDWFTVDELSSLTLADPSTRAALAVAVPSA